MTDQFHLYYFINKVVNNKEFFNIEKFSIS